MLGAGTVTIDQALAPDEIARPLGGRERLARIELWFESGESSLSVRSYASRERVSELFSVDIMARSPDPAIDLDALVGDKAAIWITSDALAGAPGGRRWSGICSFAELLHAEPTGLSTYRLRIVPSLWLLGQRRNRRIHQHLTAPEIAAEILDEWKIEPIWQINPESYPRLEYKVQFDESDLSFLYRILEEAGIAFVFAEDERSTLVLTDGLHARKGRAGSPIRYVDNPNVPLDVEVATHVRVAHEIREGAFTLRDYDPRHPAHPLFWEAIAGAEDVARLERYAYRPGSFVVELDKPTGSTPAADDQSTARHEPVAGAHRAERELLAARLGHHVVSLASNVADLSPGVVFSVSNHPAPDLGDTERLLVIESLHQGTPRQPWAVKVQAVLARTPFVPPRKTPRPTVHGVESAVVVGPIGQEIYTDEMGRVRVHFQWDRVGAEDAKASCWLRVSQGWAGTGFGMITIPRVGQEVLVGFLEGDPEQPIVVGRVYNGRNVVPYKLPEKKTVSTWRSESTPGGEGYNEIVFDDVKGVELVGVRAERDLRSLVKRDSTSTVGRHRRKLVKGRELEVTRGDHTVFVAGDRRAEVLGDVARRVEGNMIERIGEDLDLVVVGTRKQDIEGDSHDHIKGDRRARVDQKLSLTVLGDRHEKVAGRYALDASGELHIQSGQSIVIEAEDLTLRGPGGFVRIDAGGVTIKGKLVKINSSGGAPGDASAASPDAPDRALEAQVEEPDVDDVSVTGHGP